MPDMARRLLGDPARTFARKWRYGKKGPLKINLGAGTWKDFEAGEGGGVRALVQREADRPARCSRRVDPSGIPAKKGPQKAPESTNAPAPAPGLFKTATTAWGGAWPHRQQHPGAKIGGGVSVRRGNPGPRLPDEAAGVAGGRLRPCPNPCDGSRPRRLRACCAGLMNSCPRANGRVLWLFRYSGERSARNLEALTASGQRPDQARTGDRWRRNMGQVEGLRFETTDHGGGWLHVCEGEVTALALAVQCAARGRARLLSGGRPAPSTGKKILRGWGGVFSKGVGGHQAPPTRSP